MFQSFSRQRAAIIAAIISVARDRNCRQFGAKVCTALAMKIITVRGLFVSAIIEDDYETAAQP